jgi:hypothetical protein
MSNDKSKPGEPDRCQFPISLAEACDHVAKHGASREVVAAAAVIMTRYALETA